MYNFANHLFDDLFPENPKTFNLPEKYDELVAHMNATGHTFICKPSDGGCGVGIELAFTVEDLKTLVPKQKYACQRYIDNPMCFGPNQRKIDFRIMGVQFADKNSQKMTWISTKSQGRVALKPYEKVSKENYKDKEMHITFFPDIFCGEKYKIVKDDESWDEEASFICWDALANWYNENTYPNFDEKMNKKINRTMQGVMACMTPFFTFVFEKFSRPLAENNNFTFTNFNGADLMFDVDGNPHLVENNWVPSVGDYNASHETGGIINPAFLRWGKEVIELWLEYGKHKVQGTEKTLFPKTERAGVWVKAVSDSDEDENEFDNESKTMGLLVNLYLLVVSGSAEIPVYSDKYSDEEWWAKFPLDMEFDDMADALLKLSDKVSRETLRDAYDRIFSATQEWGIYILAMILTDVYSKDDALNILRTCRGN